MKLLSPTETNGILASISNTVGKSLGEQREQILQEFSLDNESGALARMIKEMKEKHWEALARAASVPQWIVDARIVLDGADMPQIQTGHQCRDPYAPTLKPVRLIARHDRQLSA